MLAAGHGLGGRIDRPADVRGEAQPFSIVVIGRLQGYISNHCRVFALVSSHTPAKTVFYFVFYAGFAAALGPLPKSVINKSLRRCEAVGELAAVLWSKHESWTQVRSVQ